MKNISVIGGGASGHAIAADLSLSGHKVTLYEDPDHRDSLNFIEMRGGIEIRGAQGNGFAKIASITTDIAEALDKKEVILIAVLASRHESIIKLCAPHLKDGQTVLIGPDNGGSLLFAKYLKEGGFKADVNIAGMGGNYYPCRIVGPAEVLVALPGRVRRIAAFPANNTEEVIHKLSGLYDFVAGKNVLEMALSSPNLINHLAASILNTGAIENSGGAYFLFRQGLTPSVLRVLETAKQERASLFKVLEYSVKSSDVLERLAQQDKYPELEPFRGLSGPTSMNHRYITEDASYGLPLMVSVAEMIDVSMPLTRAVITVASVVTGTDYLNDGRTIEKLGLSGLNVNELNGYLATGEK